MAVVVMLLVASCSSSIETPAAPLGPPVDAVEVLRSLVDAAPKAAGDDPFEVWVCHVPVDTRIGLYAPNSPRLEMSPATLAATLAEHLTTYFDAVSAGRYRPVVSPGGEVDLGADDDSQVCADRALDAAVAETTAVLLIADAEHGGDQPGGWGRPVNQSCAHRRCSARVSRRAVYVGAADFHSDWGAIPALDLVEHEIGHSLGWPHSSTADGEQRSPLDVMSDSAAPRRADPTRRHGPDVLAIDRLLAGWLEWADVVVDPPDGDVALSAEHPLAVVPLGGESVVTIELVRASGFNGHLAADGLAVHLVDLGRRPIVSVVIDETSDGEVSDGEVSDGVHEAGSLIRVGNVSIDVVSSTTFSLRRV